MPPDPPSFRMLPRSRESTLTLALVLYFRAKRRAGMSMAKEGCERNPEPLGEMGDVMLVVSWGVNTPAGRGGGGGGGGGGNFETTCLLAFLFYIYFQHIDLIILI